MGQNQGFTLIEILVTLAIASVVATGAVTFFIANNKSVATQMRVAEIQQNLRACLYTFEHEFERIGYSTSPRFSDRPDGITSAGVSSITFQFEDDSDPDDVHLETITIGLLPLSNGTGGDDNEDGIADSFPSCLRKVGEGWNNLAIAENIEVFNLVYFTADDTEVTQEGLADGSFALGDIRKIQVNIVARSSGIRRNYLDSKIYCDGQGTAIFNPLAYYGRNADELRYERRLITRTIACRNLQLD